MRRTVPTINNRAEKGAVERSGAASEQGFCIRAVPPPFSRSLVPGAGSKESATAADRHQKARDAGVGTGLSQNRARTLGANKSPSRAVNRYGDCHTRTEMRGGHCVQWGEPRGKKKQERRRPAQLPVPLFSAGRRKPSKMVSRKTRSEGAVRAAARRRRRKKERTGNRCRCRRRLAARRDTNGQRIAERG
ncbi:hypothetical protein MTO96_031208 [Rhipicephalus appendiculatus]